jgi:hypothetical protein
MYQINLKEFINNILDEVNARVIEIDLYDCDIIDGTRKMTRYLMSVMQQLREKIANYTFSSQDEEMSFFKEQKPVIMSRLLLFNKIYKIETKLPSGSDQVIRDYIHSELNSITYYFDKNLDFYQYYRSKSTTFDEHYFIRGKSDIHLVNDSAYLNSDPDFSTGYDYKVAKILANDMLEVYLKKRLQNIGKERDLEETRVKYAKTPVKFTGKKAALIELGYALAHSGDINNGNVEIKEIMDFLGAVFNIDLGDYYRTYIAIKDRKKDRTVYLNKLIEMLEKKMDEDDLY